MMALLIEVVESQDVTSPSTLLAFWLATQQISPASKMSYLDDDTPLKMVYRQARLLCLNTPFIGTPDRGQSSASSGPLDRRHASPGRGSADSYPPDGVLGALCRAYSALPFFPKRSTVAGAR